MNKLTNVLVWTLIGLVACNLILAAISFRLKYELYQHAKGEVVSLVSGVRVDGSPWRASPASCHVLRITSDNCPYCKSDHDAYMAFRQAARQTSCEIVELAPRAGEMREDAREGVTQLKYIDADLGPAIFPLATPMTFVLDGNWKVKWMRRGTFSAATLDDGIQALQAVSERKQIDIEVGPPK